MEPMNTGSFVPGSIQTTPARTAESDRTPGISTGLRGSGSRRAASHCVPEPAALSARAVTHSPITTAVPSAAEVADLLVRMPCCTARELAEALDIPGEAMAWLDAWDERRQLLRQSLLAVTPLSLAQLELTLTGKGQDACSAAGKIRDLADGQAVLTADNRALLEQLTRILDPVDGLNDWLGEALGLSHHRLQSLHSLTPDCLTKDQLQWVIETACCSQTHTCADWLTVLGRTPASDEQLEKMARLWQLPPLTGQRLPAGADTVPSIEQVITAIRECSDKGSPDPLRILELGLALELPADLLLSLLPWRDPLADLVTEPGQRLKSPADKQAARHHNGELHAGWRRNSLHTLIQAANQGRQRTCGEWLAALGLAGCDEVLLQQLAGHWQMILPAGCANWHNWCQKQRPQPVPADKTLSLSQAWQLTQEYSDSEAFGLALDDPSDRHGCAATADNPRLAGLTCLLRHTARQPSGRVSEERLRHMARFGCARLAQGRPLPLADLQAGAASRPLRPCDLLLLVAGARNPEQEALEVAALLGVGEDWAALQASHGHCSRADRALCTWRRIYNSLPGLETGHLVSLLHAFGKGELVHRLTGNAGSRMEPEQPLAQLSGRAADTLALAHQLRALPEKTLDIFAACCRLDREPGYQMPAGTESLFQILNSQAQACDKKRQALCALLDPAEEKRLAEEAAASATSARLAREAAARARQAIAPTRADSPENQVMDTGPRPPRDYVCPLTLSYMENPVAVDMPSSQGTSLVRHFEQEALLQALKVQQINPLTRGPMTLASAKKLKVDLVQLARIEYWRSQHPELEDDGKPFEPGNLQETAQPGAEAAGPMDTQAPACPEPAQPKQALWVPKKVATLSLRCQMYLTRQITDDSLLGEMHFKAQKAYQKNNENIQAQASFKLLRSTLLDMQKLTGHILQGHQFPTPLAPDERRAFVRLEEQINEMLCLGVPYKRTVQLALLMGAVLEVVTTRHVIAPRREAQPELCREPQLETFDFIYTDASGRRRRINSDRIALDALLSSYPEKLFHFSGVMKEGDLVASWQKVRACVLNHFEDDRVIFLPTFAALSQDEAEAMRRIGFCPLRLTQYYAAEVDGRLRTPMALLEHDARQMELVPEPAAARQDTS